MIPSRRHRILFRGSHSRARWDTQEAREKAEPIASALGEHIVRAGFDLILSSTKSLDSLVGKSAVQACRKLGVDPADRIRTYLEDPGDKVAGFGVVLKPDPGRRRNIRTFLVREADAVVTLIGGEGTGDCIEKALLAAKPVFPIAVAGGASEKEWLKLRQKQMLDKETSVVLGDQALPPKSMAQKVLAQCSRALTGGRRIFVVHGHDDGLKNQIARILRNLKFEPVILHELPDRGRDITTKLREALVGVGYAIVLLTPDDRAIASGTANAAETHRARQNVIFEHGLVVGLLGQDRVCAIVSGQVEIPSDLRGILFKNVLSGADASDSLAREIVKELEAAGYDVDANLLTRV